MPNDSAGQFPLPQDNQPQNPPQSTEVKLTDEIAPDLSTPPVMEDAPVQTRPAPTYTPAAVEEPPMISKPAPTVETTVAPAPSYTPPVAPMPASLPPTRKGGFPIITILLLLVSVGAIAATYFFYQQSQNLNSQLGQISQTLEQQKIKENQVTATPTPSLTLAPTNSSTISATITASITPTSPILNTNGLVFGSIDKIIATATKQYPDAQLLMVTISSADNPTNMITKYWFRQALSTKKYLYVLKEAGKDPSVVDQQVYVTPDDNIPSLNQLATNGKLGIDLDEAIKIAGGACPTSYDCVNTPVSATFIKTNTPLWQITYKPTDGSKLFVVQIDAATSKILFKSL